MALRLFGLAGVAVAVVAMSLLHVVPPSSTVNPVTRTLSEYALLSDAWVFNLGVTALAVGSLAVVGSLVRQGVIRVVSVPAFLVAVWSACLLVIVAFPKNNWAIGPSMGGTLHRIASVTSLGPY
ncbi:DUF998 domain-containing protein, partial [Kibdelosporangium lantanae]